MADSSRIGEALARFETALRKLEAAAVRWHEQEAAFGKVAGETEALRHDHSRLAQELDEVRAKASELADAGREAAKRIDNAMSHIQRVLGS